MPYDKPLTVVCSDEPQALERHTVDMLARELRQKGIEVRVVNGNASSEITGPQILIGTPGSNSRLEAARRTLDEPLSLPEEDRSGEGFALRSLNLEGDAACLALGASPRALRWAACELLDRLSTKKSLTDLGTVNRCTTPHFAFRAASIGMSLDPQEGRDARMARVREDIEYALRLRLNTAVFGLDWPANWSSLVTYRFFPSLADTVDGDEIVHKAAVAGDILSYATDRGMDVYLTLTELFYPPELAQHHPEALATAPPRGADRWYRPPASSFTSLARPDKLCPSHATTRAFFKAKIRELAERFPQIAGVQIWVSHGTCDVFYCDCPQCHALKPHERLSRLCQDTLEAMDQAGLTEGKLILRTYLGGWRQAVAEQFFLPLAGHLPQRVIVGTKAQYGDMYYENAIHPLAGTFPGNDEAIEFCLGGEYRAGLQWGTVAPIVEDVARRARQHARLGCTGLWMRHIEWRNRLNEIDFAAFGVLAWNPYALTEPVWTRWAERRFGPAGPDVVGILRGCTEVMSQSLYAHGVSLTHWAVFPESLQRLRHLTMDRSAQATEDGYARVAPTWENHARMLAEKDRAISRADELLGNLERIQSELAPRDYEALHRSLSIQRELARVFRGLTDCFWRYLIWERTLSEVEREWQRDALLAALTKWRETIAGARETVGEQYDRCLFETLGTRSGVWQPARRPQGYYFEHLDQICCDIEERIDVEPASVWGYYPPGDASGR
jgi:hypothetical protein